MANIKDYIIDIEQQRGEQEKKKTISKSEYSIVLENDTDFIINRKSTRIDKDLVFLISQELFYIKDNKSDKVTRLDSDNCRRMINQFQKDMDKYLKFEKVVWTQDSETDNLVSVIQSYEKRFIIKEGFGVQEAHLLRVITPLLKQNKKLLRYYFEKIKTFKNTDLLNAVFAIEKDFNYNNAKYLIDIYANNTRISRDGRIEHMIQLLNSKSIEFDINRFLDYITTGLYCQGIQFLNWDTRHIYKDYLSMSKEMYGKVKDKYPKHLKTEHDKVVLKYNLWSKYREGIKVFNITDKQRELEYKDRGYSIVIPETSVDIIDEAINQCNCVASYIDDILDGNTFICFMRENNNLNDSYITIEVKNDTIVQVKGYANRNATIEELDFIKKWAKDKKLKLMI